MKQFAWRLGQRLLLLVGVSLCTFVLLSAAPGNFFDDLKLNPQISAATVAACKSQYGANRPLPERYARWVESIFRGDWGYSLSYHCPVGGLVWQRARNTLLLTAFAVLLAWMLALPWGIAEALYKGGWVDRTGEGGVHGLAHRLAQVDLVIGRVPERDVAVIGLEPLLAPLVLPDRVVVPHLELVLSAEQALR